jgi:hypothetical protein
MVIDVERAVRLVSVLEVGPSGRGRNALVDQCAVEPFGISVRSLGMRNVSVSAMIAGTARNREPKYGPACE